MTLNQIKSETVPVKIAVGSFASGTVFFISHVLFPDEIYILVMGCCFFVGAILIHLCALLYLMYKASDTPSYRNKTTEEFLYVLSIIPIIALYLFIIINQNNLF
jgi:hypothetical protein